ncbi:hypothetical protein [Nocardia transvalensis]|uniref:hypothetical protein n=1 Tax=Nocardia transvalensis TaxID=37333 RepID=UPI001894EFF4|nr:hypothetical protein [Nocardia transvalensis]MBF6333479.1 hypothetical protein [Nocardia transvalensis]
MGWNAGTAPEGAFGTTCVITTDLGIPHWDPASGLAFTISLDSPIDFATLRELAEPGPRHQRAVLMASFVQWLARDLDRARGSAHEEAARFENASTRARYSGGTWRRVAAAAQMWAGWALLLQFLADVGAVNLEERRRFGDLARTGLASALDRIAASDSQGAHQKHFPETAFRTASRSARKPKGRHVQVARGGGLVQLRCADLSGEMTAVTLTEDEFDEYQRGARRGTPTDTPLRIVRNSKQDYMVCHATNAAAGSCHPDQRGFLAFLDGVHRGEFGGPSDYRSEGLSSGHGRIMAAPPASDRLNAWQRQDGFPCDKYFEEVAAAFERAGIGIEDWWRDEDWDACFVLDPAAYADGPLDNWQTAHGLTVTWRTQETDNPTHADDFSGQGWYYVTYSRPHALGDHVGELNLPYLAEPAAVAAAVATLIGRSVHPDG